MRYGVFWTEDGSNKWTILHNRRSACRLGRMGLGIVGQLDDAHMLPYSDPCRLDRFKRDMVVIRDYRPSTERMKGSR